MKSIAPPTEARFTRISVPLITSLIVALCFLLYWQAGQLRHHQQWVSHSYQVRLEVEELDRSMREAESIQRAILLAGSESAVLQDSFAALISSVRTHHASLRALVSDNTKQAELVDALAPPLFSRLETLDRNSRDLRSLSGDERTTRILDGVANTDRIETMLEEIRKSESALLNTRADAAHAAGSRLLVLATGGSALGVAVMIIAMFQEKRNRRLREQYQDRLAEARDNALDSVKATSIFVASVSHEIRTPMNGVLGAAHLLGQDTRLDRRQLELVDTIRYSGEALLDLVNDILDLSKLQAGKMEFIREDFSLHEVLDESLTIFADAAGRKRLELAHRIDPALPRRFRGDPHRVRQVLVNLIGNAVKFTDKGGVSIEVTAREHDDPGKPVLLFRVTDTGPGISDEEKPHLFQPFSQVNIRLNRRDSGTGLGLAISREIVERLGGAMGVDSTPGKGSTFWFTVRLDSAEEAPDHDKHPRNVETPLPVESRDLTVAPDSESLPDARILLIEDNPINQRIFGRQLETLGIRMEISGDGGDGVAARKSGGFDLILMDCQLPTMDGFEATRLIREWEKETQSPKVPIIAITAHVGIGDAEACYQAGMDDYLPKPFDLAKLKAKLARWLSAKESETPVVEKPVDVSAVLDEAQLAGCLTGDPTMDEGLIGDSLVEIGKNLEVMKLSLTTLTDSDWRNAAHRALGTAAVLGFAELASVLREAEHDDGNWEKRAAGFSGWETSVSRTRAALRQSGHLPAAGITEPV